jgi:HSP20 family protein
MAKSSKRPAPNGNGNGSGGETTDLSSLGGFFGGLGTLIEKLGELAEKGEEFKAANGGGEFGDGSKVKGVYGFTIRTGLGDREGSSNQSVKVEPFGNVRADSKTGRATVHEVIEPMIDVFEEPDHVLVVAEMPGIAEDNVTLDLKDDILTITAERGPRKYRKEVLLPASFALENLSRTCRNGMLEVRLAR